MESPNGSILQGALAGQYFDADPDEELLELLDELLLVEEELPPRGIK
jgi:hypothetical protein